MSYKRVETTAFLNSIPSVAHLTEIVAARIQMSTIKAKIVVRITKATFLGT